MTRGDRIVIAMAWIVMALTNLLALAGLAGVIP